MISEKAEGVWARAFADLETALKIAAAQSRADVRVLLPPQPGNAALPQKIHIRSDIKPQRTSDGTSESEFTRIPQSTRCGPRLIFLLRHTEVGLLRTAVNAAVHKSPVAAARTGSACNSTYREIR